MRTILWRQRAAVALSPLQATVLAGGAVASLLTGAAAAQHVPDAGAAQDAAADDQQRTLEDIIVTAQKRAENLQDVPISVQAVSGDDLAARGIVSTAELGTAVSGINIRVNNSSFLPYVRGIGANSGFAENPTSLYIDGVYVPQSRGALRDLNDIAQVTVLKGPQGTLFGRNSTAGVIQITTKAPSHDPHLDGSVSFDNFETLRTSVYVTGGITDTIAASVSAGYSTQGKGWGRNLTTGADTHRQDHRFAIRGKLLFEPGPDTDITLIGEHFDERLDGIARVPYPGTRFSYSGFGPTSSPFDTYSETDGFLSNKGSNGSLTISQGLGFADLLSISAYRRQTGGSLFDNDSTAQPLFIVAIDNAAKTYTQELQLSSPQGGAFQWVVGGFYFHNVDKVDPSINTSRPPFSAALSYTRRDSRQTTESLAGFGQATLEIARGTKITGGARYTWEKRDLAGVQTVTPAVPTGPGTLRYSSQSVEKPTFRVALDHEFGRDILGYVSFNTGFKSGGYNLLAPNAAPYLPETLKAYEAGFKTELLDRKVRLNGSLFYNDYSNIQVAQVINNVSTVSNAAAAETYGLDLDFQALLAEGLQVSGGLEVLHAEYTRYAGAQIATPIATGGATITSGNVAGNRLPNAQKFNANLAVDYKVPLGGSSLSLNATGAYQGDYFFEPDNVVRQPSYVTLNTSAKLLFAEDRVSLTVWGRNLLDEKVITTASSTRTGYSIVYDFAPRTYGATLGFSF